MRFKYIIYLLVVILVVGGIYLVYAINKAGQDVKQASDSTGNSNQTVTNNDNQSNMETSAPEEPVAVKPFVAPIDRARERVTKKPFGININPKTSPVQPERFSGYHTGTDFETFPEEKDTNVEFKAICTGKLLSKRTADGYGGIVLQACELDGQPVTILYGHIRLSSVTAKVDTNLEAGKTIGVLGTGYSSETDGERKHLHVGIHKGSSAVILGYVSNQADLGQWLNVLDYF